MELFRGTKRLVDVCREHDLKQSDFEAWMETLLQGGEKSLEVNAEDEQASHEREVKELRDKIGELVLEIDFRKK